MQNILQHLFEKNNLKEVSVDALQHITEEFPYFGIAQYLLASKLKEDQSATFNNQFQKTLIYIHNPLWLQYQLSLKNRVPEIAAPTLEPSINTPAGQLPSGNETPLLPPDYSESHLLKKEDHPENPESFTGLDTPATAQSDAQATVQPEVEKQTIQRAEPVTFQAYYTIDYFASQGIKLSLDNQQQDKLGKQLKSFTEWLKTMRRLPETSVVEIMEKINDGAIAQIAAHSLEENEILTEAMAEVLVKQHKNDKAIELYAKLSLLNPHKSSYFATKIEDLKQH